MEGKTEAYESQEAEEYLARVLASHSSEVLLVDVSWALFPLSWVLVSHG